MPERPLQNLRILITRPAHQAAPLSALIAELGGQPYLLPTIEITPPPDLEQLAQVLQKLPEQQQVIFLSANTLRYTQSYWPRPFPKVITIAIGTGTAQALHKAKIPVDYIPELQSSEGLLALPTLQSVAGERLMICCGRDSRPLLKNTLTDRGARITEAICYQRNYPSSINQAVDFQLIDVVICTSIQTLEHLWQLSTPSQRQLWIQRRLVTISERMTRYAQELMPASQLMQASNASDEAIIDALIKQTGYTHRDLRCDSRIFK